jgi:hypothetical protein
VLTVRRYRDRAVRWCTESEGELFYCFWFPLQKMNLTDVDAIIFTVFLRVRGVGRILLPLDILYACRTQRSCYHAPGNNRRP